MTTEYLGKGAVLSEDGKYRYALGRRWAWDGPVATFVMLNPSTADADNDDATIRKCVGFAQQWGMVAIHILNLYAYRSRDPKPLWDGTVEDPVGPRNDEFLLRHAATMHINRWPLVFAWGAFPKTKPRATQVLEMFGVWADSVQCLGTSKDGSPRHPLMLAYATDLEPYRPVRPQPPAQPAPVFTGPLAL